MGRVFPNKYPGTCHFEGCSHRVAVGEGFVERDANSNKWITWCAEHAPNQQAATPRSPSIPKAEPPSEFARKRTALNLFPNKFRKKCAQGDCESLVEPGDGYIERIDQEDGPVLWRTWCKAHVPRMGAGKVELDSKARQEFLSEVLSNPKDDTVRLIFADWLDEHGDPLGEFIRIQVELAKIDVNEDYFAEDSRRNRLSLLWERERELLEVHEQSWSASIPGGVHECLFRRGLVEGVVIRNERFLQTGDELFHFAPITHVKLAHVSDRFDELHDSPLLERLDTLSLKSSDNPIGAARANRFLRSAHLSNLMGLDLGKNQIRRTGIQALVESHQLGSLQVLGLQDNLVGDTELEMLAAWPGLAQIKELHLRRNQIGDEGLAALAGSKHAANLTLLDLNQNQIGSEGMAALASSAYITRLEHLDVSDSIRHRKGESSGGEELADSPILDRLVSLAIWQSALSTRAMTRFQERFPVPIQRAKQRETWTQYVPGLFCSDRFHPKPPRPRSY